jgi:hypothetical protein
METMEYFKTIVTIMLFYSFCINVITYAMPSDALQYVTSFSDLGNSITTSDITGEIEDSLSQQTNIPVIDVGSLVFYSGNFLLDLLLNFMFAIPEMIGLLVTAFCMLVNLDTSLAAYVSIFAAAITSALYLIGAIQFILGIRSGVHLT